MTFLVVFCLSLISVQIDVTQRYNETRHRNLGGKCCASVDYTRTICVTVHTVFAVLVIMIITIICKYSKTMFMMLFNVEMALETLQML